MNPETNRLPQRPREHEADELALSRVTTKLGTETICGLLSKLPAVTSTLQSAVTTSADACNTCHSQHDRLSNGNKAKGKNKCSKENKDQHEDRHEEDNDEDEASFLSGLLVENKETLSCREHEQAMRSLNSKWRRTLRRTEKQLVTQSKIFQAERKSLELKIESAIASAGTSSTMGADKGGNNGHDEDSQQSAEIIAALEGIKYQHKQDMQEAVEQARKQERNHMERQMKKTLDMCQKNSMILGNAAATAIEDQERLFDEHQQELDDVAARHRLDMATMQRLYDHRLEEQRRQFEADLGQQQAKFDNELERRLRDLTSLYESKLRASPASIVSEMIPFQEGERDDEQNSSQATYSETDFDIDKRHEVEARDERIEELEQTLAAMQLDHENEIAIIQEAFEKQTNGMQQTFEQELSWLKLEHEAALAEANAEAHDCELLEREEIDELNQRILNLSNTHQRELLDLSISHQREKLEAIEKAVQDTAEQLQSDHDENLIRLRVDLEDEKQNALDELRGCLEADETRSEDSLGVSKARSKRTLLADDASEEHCRTLEEELDQCREDLQKMKSQTNSLMEQHQQEIDELEQAHTERINELMSDHQVEIEKMYETRISEEEEELGEKTDCCCEDLQRQLFVSRSQVAEANKHLREAEELHNSHFQRLNASFAAQKETLECELERLTSQYQHSLDERDQTIDALNSQSSGLKDQISVYEAKVHSMSERHQADVSSLREMVEHIKTERDSILSEKERLVEGHASTLKANEEAMECLQSAFRKAETEIATLQATTEQLQDKHRTELQNLANQLSNCERCRSHEMEILKTQALLKASQRECMELQQRIDRSTPERGRSHRQSETSGAGEEGSKVALDSLFLKEMLLDSGLNDSMRLESPQTPGGRLKKKQRAESLQPEVAETNGVLSPVNRPPLLRRTSSAQSFRSLATISPVMERSVAGVAVTKARSKGYKASSQKRKVRIMLLGVSSTAKVRKVRILCQETFPLFSMPLTVLSVCLKPERRIG